MAGINESSYKVDWEKNLVADVEKVCTCAFVPCPMATCALKCVNVSAINLPRLSDICSYDRGWQYAVINGGLCCKLCKHTRHSTELFKCMCCRTYVIVR